LFEAVDQWLKQPVLSGSPLSGLFVMIVTAAVMRVWYKREPTPPLQRSMTKDAFAAVGGFLTRLRANEHPVLVLVAAVQMLLLGMFIQPAASSGDKVADAEAIIRQAYAAGAEENAEQISAFRDGLHYGLEEYYMETRPDTKDAKFEAAVKAKNVTAAVYNKAVLKGLNPQALVDGVYRRVYRELAAVLPVKPAESPTVVDRARGVLSLPESRASLVGAGGLLLAVTLTRLGHKHSV